MTILANVAIVGGTHILCEPLLEILQERSFPLAKLDVFDEAEHEGDFVPFNKKSISIKSLSDMNVTAYNIIFNFNEDFIGLQQANIPQSTYVIDFSAVKDNGNNTPVFVVPEVNPQQLDAGNVFQVPNAAAIATSLILNKLALDISQVHLHVMQPVSVYGKAGIDELAKQTTNLLNAKPIEPNIFKQQIAFNVLVTDTFEGEASHEEAGIINALKQVYPGEYLLNVNVVTVPVFHGVSLNLTLQTYDDIAIVAVYDALANDDTFEIIEYDSEEPAPSVVADANGTDKIYISRIRVGNTDQNMINLWCVLDNGRKGALKGVQMGEILVKSYL